jgi:hypothetical protein
MVRQRTNRNRHTTSHKDLVCGTDESGCGRYHRERVCTTTVHVPVTRTLPIRSLPMGFNRLSFKYVDAVPIETGIGVMVNTTGWSNVIDLNSSSYLPSCIHNGVEFFRTAHLELPWRLLDHGYVKPRDDHMWYIIPRGRSIGIFYFVSPVGDASETVQGTWKGIRRLHEDDDGELGTFDPCVEGVVSIDSFVSRVLHQKVRMIYSALLTMIPKYMDIHAISEGSISNRKHRLLRSPYTVRPSHKE